MNFKKDFIYRVLITIMLTTFMFTNIAFSYPSTIVTSLRVPINKIDKKRHSDVLIKAQREKNDKEYWRLSDINGHLKDSHAWDIEKESITKKQLALLKDMSTESLISELLDPQGHGNKSNIIRRCQEILAGRIASGEATKKEVVDVLFGIQGNLQRPFSRYEVIFFLMLIDASKISKVKEYAKYIVNNSPEISERDIARELLAQSIKTEVAGNKIETRMRQIFAEREYYGLYDPGNEMNEIMGHSTERRITAQQLKLLKHMSTNALCDELLEPQTPWTYRESIISGCGNILATRISRGELKKKEIVSLLLKKMENYSSYTYIKDVLYFFEKIKAFEIDAALAYLKKISRAKYVEDADLVALDMLKSLKKTNRADAGKLKKSRAGKSL